MDKFEKDVQKRLKEALKQLQDEKVAEPDWKFDDVDCQKLKAAPGAPEGTMVCKTRAHRKKAKEEMQLSLTVQLPGDMEMALTSFVTSFKERFREHKRGAGGGGNDPAGGRG